MASGTIHRNPVLLWENSSPSSAFAGQTITSANIRGTLSNFSLILFEYSYTTGSAVSSVFASTGSSARLTASYVGSNNVYVAQRSASMDLTNNTIAISDCTRTGLTSISPATANSYDIPLKIYGIY